MNTNQSNTNPAPATTEGTAPTCPYHYYVSIIDFQGSSLRTSDMELNRSHPIRTMDDVEDVKRYVRKQYGFVNPQVSFSLLRNDLAAHRGQR